MDAGANRLAITVDAPIAQADRKNADGRAATQFQGSPSDTLTSFGMALHVVDTPPNGIWSLNKDRLVAVGLDIDLAELAAMGYGSLSLSFDLVNDHGVAVYLGVDRSNLPDHPERSRISAMFSETTCEVRSGSQVMKQAAIPPFHGNIPRHIIQELDAGSLRILVDGHPIVEKVDGIQANDTGGSPLAFSAQAGASIDNLRVDRLDLAEAPLSPL